MPTSYGALCTDFYVNLKVALQMDLPTDRETILHLFDSVRRSEPAMTHFKRYRNELALESSRREPEYKWVALRQNSVRAGHVNPQEMESAYKYHQLILEIAPYNLTISPLDVDFVEVVLGFDLECPDNHDEVVCEALYGDTPLAELNGIRGARLIDVQPIFGLSLDKRGDEHAYFEVKTRSKSKRGKGKYRDEPISLFLTMRRHGPIDRVDDLHPIYKELATKADELASDYLIPNMLTPIARQITSSA